MKETLSFKKDLAARLELRDQIEKNICTRLKGEFAEKEAQLLSQISILKHQLGEAESSLAAVNLVVAGLRELVSSGDEIRKSHDQLSAKLKVEREKVASLKAEFADYKARNPTDLKQKLDKKKKELKDKVDGIARLQSLLVKRDKECEALQVSIAGMKARIERQDKIKESSSDAYLYKSKCGDFRVFSTDFQSESHPLLENGLNYRVIDMRSGSSSVVKIDLDRVSASNAPGFLFESLQTVPSDVEQFIVDMIRISGANVG